MGNIEFILFIFAVFLMFFFLLYVGKKLAGLITKHSFAIKRWIRLTTHSRRFYVIVMTCLLLAPCLTQAYDEKKETEPDTMGGSMLMGTVSCGTGETIAEYAFTNIDESNFFGRTGDFTADLGQKWQTTANADTTTISVQLKKIGNPTDNLVMKIYEGMPTTTLLGTSGNLDASTLTTDLATYTFTFSPTVAVETGTTYSFAIFRSGAYDNSNYFAIGFDGSSPTYTDGNSIYRPENGSWTDISGTDRAFEICGELAGEAPTPEFSGTPTSGTAPLSVDFTDESTGTPTSWFWDFGDDEYGTDQNPTHVYSTSGTYNVAMGATNAYGTATSTKNAYITVNEAFEFTGISANLSNFLDNGNFTKTIIWFCAGLLLTAFLIAFSLIFKAFRDIM